MKKPYENLIDDKIFPDKLQRLLSGYDDGFLEELEELDIELLEFESELEELERLENEAH